jgi:hypothetical protein
MGCARPGIGRGGGMSTDRNKLAQELSIEALDRLVSDLASLPGKERTLAAIQRRAEAMGIRISLMSAKAFRNTTFRRHLERLRAAQEIAVQIEEIEQGGNTMADASAKLLSKRIFNQLIEAEEEDGAGGEVDVEATSLALSRLRSGDVAKQALAAKLRESEAKVRALEAREAEREEKKALLRDQLSKAKEKKGGVTKETIEGIERDLALL